MNLNFYSSEYFIRIFLLTLPLIFGGILHMVAVKWDILSYLKKPLHQRLFGSNKTWRGFLIMPLATWPGVYFSSQLEILFETSTPVFQNHSLVIVSLLLGLAYCLAELPNSFIKRRLGVKEGQTSERFKLFFIILDQADSVIGCLVAYAIILDMDKLTFWGTLLAGTFIHLFFNYSLYLMKLDRMT
jgi:CDP-diacylglycerol--serine O-phosphatidyltransferase